MNPRSLLFIVLFWCTTLPGQHTFSIVAVDEETGEIGSAGATCLDVIQEGVSVIIISDIIPGRGAIHTQAAYNASNQAMARSRLEFGQAPQGVIDFITSNDVSNNPGIRQYGIVDFALDGTARSAAFTGANCFDYKGHRLGDNYAIQGNILLGPQVLDSMEARFLAAEGSLAFRLLEAMQGANIPGADERCLEEGVSSRSAFLRVWHPGEEGLLLDLHVPATPFAVEPLDSIQTLYDEWLLTGIGQELNDPGFELSLSPNPSHGFCRATWTSHETEPLTLVLYSSSGKEWYRYVTEPMETSLDLPSPATAGLYFLQLQSASGRILTTEKVVYLD